MNPQITHIGTACCLIEFSGYKILTDPVLDLAGGRYHHGFGSFSKKTSDPIVTDEQLKNIDLILLSHPQHKDNFDTKGQEIAKIVPLILSTIRIKKKYSNSIGLKAWQTHTIQLPDKSKLKITATPAQHHPHWLPQFFAGEVIGFILEHDTSQRTIYITGDTIFYKGIQEVARKFGTIDLALIHVGSAEIRYLTGFGKYTMAAKGFIKTIQTIKPTVAIPIHNDGWSHFQENDEGIRSALKNEPQALQQKVYFLRKGKSEQIRLD